MTIKSLCVLSTASLALIIAQPASPVTYRDGLVHIIDTPVPDEIQVFDSPEGEPTTVVLIDGGSSRTVSLTENSIGHLDGGRVYQGSIIATGASRLTVSRGEVDTGIHFEGSSFLMEGGVVGTIRVETDTVRASMTGGRTQSLVMAEGAELDWHGGIIFGELLIRSASVLTLYGSDFAIDGVPVGYGLLEQQGELTGRLSSGDSLLNDAKFLHASHSRGFIYLVPEPSTMTLVALGMVGLARRRSLRSQRSGSQKPCDRFPD